MGWMVENGTLETFKKEHSYASRMWRVLSGCMAKQEQLNLLELKGG